MKDKKDNKMDEIRKSLPEGVTASGIFSDNDLRVLDALSVLNGMEYAKENGEFFVTNERLKQLAEIKDNMTLSRSIKKFERCELIERKPGKRGTASVYILHEDRMEQFTNANTNQKQCKKPKKRVTTMEETVTKKVTNDDMLPNLIINELQQLRETVTTLLNELVTEIATLNANLLKINMGNNSNKKGNKVDDVTTDTDTESETEMSLIESTHIVTSPVLKEIERKKNKKNNSPRVSERKGAAATGVVVVSDENEVSGKAGDTPAGPRDANGAFLNEKPADAQHPSGGNHPDPSSGVSRTVEPPQASGIGDSANPHCGEQEEKTPPPPAPAENANKRHLSAPESQNELHLKPEGENPSGDKPEPQGASCWEEHSSMEVAWADEAMKEAEARGDAQAYLNAIHARHDACRKEDGAKASRGKVSDSEIERLYREAFVERTLDANTLPPGILNALGRYADSLERAKPKPYPDTEPLGNVIYEPASTREARIERKATTRYA